MHYQLVFIHRISELLTTEKTKPIVVESIGMHVALDPDVKCASNCLQDVSCFASVRFPVRYNDITTYMALQWIIVVRAISVYTMPL